METEPLFHNHIPVKGVVPGCRYCEQYGNIFEKGQVCLDLVNIPYMYAFKKELCINANETTDSYRRR